MPAPMMASEDVMDVARVPVCVGVTDVATTAPRSGTATHDTAGRRSLLFDVGLPRHLVPPLDLRCDRADIVLRRAADRLDADGGEALADRRLLDHGDQRVLQLADDRIRRAG